MSAPRVTTVTAHVATVPTYPGGPHVRVSIDAGEGGRLVLALVDDNGAPWAQDGRGWFDLPATIAPSLAEALGAVHAAERSE